MDWPSLRRLPPAAVLRLAVSAPPRTPLAQRPAALWQAVALISVVINLLLIYILLVR